MKGIFYFRIAIALAVAVSLASVGCSAKKETLREGSSPAQTEMKQEAAPEPKTESKPTEGAEKIAPAQSAYEMSDIHFDYDDYALRPDDRKILGNYADWLLNNSEYRVKIEGNCDERGTEEYNMALGQRRADEAKKYLVNMGINEKRISTISYGKVRPVDPGHNEGAWAKNRRDKFVLNEK